jgi:hypothetical protein
MAHTCHALGCSVSVKPEMLMCGRHWRRVAKNIQRAVWRHYRPGQCDDKRPSKEWHQAADAAIGYVAFNEGKPINKAKVDALIAYGFAELVRPRTEIRGVRATIVYIDDPIFDMPKDPE